MEQNPTNNFLFVNKTQVPHTLSHSTSEEIVQLRRQVQRVSRAKAKSQALQNLRSRRSLWQPLTARRDSLTRGRAGETNQQAENYGSPGLPGLPYRDQPKPQCEHEPPCICLDLPVPCSHSEQVAQEVGAARQPLPPTFQLRQPEVDNDAITFATIHGSPVEERSYGQLVSRGLKKWERFQHVHLSKDPVTPSGLGRALPLEDPEEGSAYSAALSNAPSFGARMPGRKPTLLTDQLNSRVGRIDETIGVHRSKRCSMVDAMSIGSEHPDTSPSFLSPPTTIYPRQNKVNKWLGAGRMDPFSSFPINLDRISQRCIDHFIHTMAFIEFNIKEGAPLNPSRHFAFASALSSPAAFHAIVATGAVHLTSLYSEGTSVVATHHLAQSQRLLRKSLQKFNRETCAGTMQAMAELAATEDFRGQHESSRIHLRGMRDFLSLHGGVEASGISSRVQLLSCYVCNSVSASYLPEIRMTRTLYPNSRDSIAAALNEMAESTSDASEDKRRNLSDVIAHVHELMKLLNSVIEGSYPGWHSSGVRSLWTNFFHPGNELHDMLSMSTDDKMHSGGLGPKGHHRMSCLFLLTVNLLDFTENEQATMDYLGKLQQLFQQYDLRAHPNPRLLHFILLQDCTLTRIGDTKTAWKVVGLMQVYKLLSAQMKEYVNNIILHFLTNCGPHIICAPPDLKFLLQDVFSALVCPDLVEELSIRTSVERVRM